MTHHISTQLVGHGLWYEGRVLRDGFLGNGTGKPQCRCGAWSPELPTTAQRKRWHREHKAQVTGR